MVVFSWLPDWSRGDRRARELAAWAGGPRGVDCPTFSVFLSFPSVFSPYPPPLLVTTGFESSFSTCSRAAGSGEATLRNGPCAGAAR